MSSVKRLRIFAGPNGSGKSTFINAVRKKPPIESFKLGYYINADDIQQEFKSKKKLSIEQFGMSINSKQIQSYFKKSTFSPVRLEILATVDFVKKDKLGMNQEDIVKTIHNWSDRKRNLFQEKYIRIATDHLHEYSNRLEIM